MNIVDMENQIVMKERQQMQLEEIRSILDQKLKPQRPLIIQQIDKDQIFTNPTDNTYLQYLRKPQKIQNNQDLCISKGQLKIQENGQQVEMYELRNLTFVQQLKKNRLHLVFQGSQSTYLQFETQRKQLKFFESLNFAIENKLFK
ncbi:unnamed protein product [Paramecium octaurelia]|uniref:Uncharacterized protein n=1 Tax=Paramecium octaurelia TaxID=43137 RepID=A0A8S1T789_PAROT|nr:unnamed protein product [Paramecium octaurelia]